MSELRLKIVENNTTPLDCGIDSINEMINDAYFTTLYKQACAYDILVDGRVIGSCMVRFCVICCEDDYCVGEPEFPAYEISYLAIGKRYQRKGIGSKVLKMLISDAEKTISRYPIRFLVIEALRNKVDWYLKYGFSKYERLGRDGRFPNTVSMRMDFIDKASADAAALLN